MTIKQTTPDQAKNILDSNPEAVYLDVRSVQEFIQGHAEGAINIPLMHYNESTNQMEPNAEFPTVVTRVLPAEKTYVVGCKMGGRSQRACEIMHQLGYSDLYNIDGGFHGNDRQAGWLTLGLPVTTDNGEGISYESLRSQVSNSKD